MKDELLEAYQKAAKYMADVFYLHSILNLIREALLVHTGQELVKVIDDLAAKGLNQTRIEKGRLGNR